VNTASSKSPLASVWENDLDGPDTWRRDPRNALIADLHSGGALTRHQADLLLDAWPHLDEDWAASPYFRTLCEHSRAYINQAQRRAEKTAQGSDATCSAPTGGTQ
jgi:hypothetical protein